MANELEKTLLGTSKRSVNNTIDKNSTYIEQKKLHRVYITSQEPESPTDGEIWFDTTGNDIELYPPPSVSIDYVTKYTVDLKDILKIEQHEAAQYISFHIPTSTTFEVVPYKYYYRPVGFKDTGIQIIYRSDLFEYQSADAPNRSYIDKDGNRVTDSDWQKEYTSKAFLFEFTGDKEYSIKFPIASGLAGNTLRTTIYKADSEYTSFKEFYDYLFSFKDNVADLNVTMTMTIVPQVE